MRQPTAQGERRPSPGRLGEIGSALARVEELTAEMRHHANSQGQHYQHTAALKRACALLEPPIGLSTYYRYRRIRSTHHPGEARDWLGFLTRLETGRSTNY